MFYHIIFFLLTYILLTQNINQKFLIGYIMLYTIKHYYYYSSSFISVVRLYILIIGTGYNKKVSFNATIQLEPINDKAVLNLSYSPSYRIIYNYVL